MPGSERPQTHALDRRPPGSVISDVWAQIYAIMICADLNSDIRELMTLLGLKDGRAFNDVLSNTSLSD